MPQGTPDRTFGEADGTPDVRSDDVEILTEAEHATADHGGVPGVVTGQIQTARASTGSVGAAAEANVTLTWPTGFSDGDYAVTASMMEDDDGEALRVRRIKTKSATGIVVNCVNNGLISHTGTVHAIAVADA